MTDQDHKLAVALTRLEGMIGDVADIKATLRELTAAVARLALVEERQASSASALGRAFKEIEDLESRLASLELAQPTQKQAADWVHKVVWAVVSGALVALLGLVLARPTQPVLPGPAIVEPRRP